MQVSREIGDENVGFGPRCGVSAAAWQISENGVVAPGKRAGERRKQSFRTALPALPGLLALLGLALAVTLSIVAWGYLVVAAIDFGGAAREGDGAAWGYLALASLGAVACLFLALILLSRISRALGLTRPPDDRR